jgi:hypothetical protein
VRPVGLSKLKQSNGLTGTRSGFLPACNIVLQPSTLPRAPIFHIDVLFPCIGNADGSRSTIVLNIISGINFADKRRSARAV